MLRGAPSLLQPHRPLPYPAPLQPRASHHSAGSPLASCAPLPPLAPGHRSAVYPPRQVGNCFSLQKEHDVALKFFQRAIQLQPDLAYAYTLSGHEYSANDDFDKAMACYRSAIRIDERHYGPDHPNVQQDLEELCRLRRAPPA